MPMPRVSWPDYLSISGLVRKFLAGIWQGLTGADPWIWLWEWLGGDYEQIGKVADAWKNLSAYFKELPEELTNRMQIMFTGWFDSPGATAAGEYFAQAGHALEGVADPLSSLATKYNDIAWSSYGFFQAVYSLVDAAIDAIAAALIEGASVLGLAAVVTAKPAAVTAVIAAIESVSSAWSWMMTGVNAVLGFAALLGAATTQVNWVTLPEG